jgi:peptide/nickel transport system substrate-binding protein
MTNPSDLSRRTFLAGAAALTAYAWTNSLHALGRTAHGGRVSFQLPWATRSLDPHDVRDPCAALFSTAIADPLYSVDPAGNLHSVLAEGLPIKESRGTVIRLRSGLLTARKKPLEAKDVLFSIERARSRGAAAIFVEVPTPTLVKKEPLTLIFGSADPHKLARILALPISAILPRSFDSFTPDGTGAFRADCTDKQMILTRNALAARGPAFLERIEVQRAPDMASSLRQFEAERTDIGWLGLGLHADRKGAVRFDLGRAAYIVLWIDPRIGSFGAPGIAQKLIDSIPPGRLSHLGLGPLPPASGNFFWGGPAMELWVDEASAHMVEIAKTLGPILSQPGREITVVPLARSEIMKRRGKGRVGMSLEVVRPLTQGTQGLWASLIAADDPVRARELALKPPKFLPNVSGRFLTQNMQLGILGEMRIMGGITPDISLAHDLDGWDWSSSFRKKK